MQILSCFGYSSVSEFLREVVQEVVVFGAIWLMLWGVC